MERIKTACSKCGGGNLKSISAQFQTYVCKNFLQGYWESVAACGYSGTQQYRGDKDLCFGWNYGMEKEHGNVRDACRMTT